ncbi:indolepyruvate decarboxylase 1 [Saccharomycopsis crataegensis]|uniref:Indolepyruvate decarboxylase 1 n=1 Tax=Saccharomycopsis crataegensis TaxID=43959 RepID=A0AAV5QHG5_9ASCO|nr:indolepyruvate decarboxylase 1 [Saccharomycopsis crataegensis]
MTGAAANSTKVPLGLYIFTRLHQVGIDTVFGLPGDFNLALLDYIYDVPEMKWAGNANELNAAYAADGYARIKKLSALITTYGVGELSTLCGIGGAASESLGVIHIVGTPSTEAQSKKLLLHHTLGDGDFNVFQRMSSELSKATYSIDDIKTATKHIDDAIKTAWTYQKPVYVGLPTNFVNMEVDASLLKTPIDLTLPPNDPATEDEIFEEILRLVAKCKNPIILVDACAVRYNVKEETEKLMAITQFPTFVSPMGKSAVTEEDPRFGGVYIGSLSTPEVKEVVNSADLVISVGSLMSDFNTGSFTYGFDIHNMIEFHSDYTKIKRAIYPKTQMQSLLKKITTNENWISRLKAANSAYVPKDHPIPAAHYKPEKEMTDDSSLTQAWFWNELSTWLQEGDIIITETGTSAFGIASTKFPKNTIGISQVLWGSIGYTVGSCLGASFASTELAKPRRVLLFVGDGSLQLTVQEISTMIRWNLTPYLFVLNNSGYTIEKLIHGPTAGYNEIQPWRHQLLLKTFGATEENSESMEIKTVKEVKDLFKDVEFSKADKIRLVELFFPIMDAPDSLVKQAEMTASTNKK